MLSATPQQNDDLRAALDRLFSLQTFGVKLGLDSTLHLLHRFGNPHSKLRCIHVAGTNGKGSVCAMIASALQAAGLRVGLFSSPHLTRFNERIRVNNHTIDDDTLVTYTRQMMPVVLELQCTFFEATTAMAFRYFVEQGVDLAVIEVGLGGRLDSTNVITPLLSVITSIGYDHTKHLGDTLELIAGEKAGIIKPDVPSVVGPVPTHLRAVFRQKSLQVNAPPPVFTDDVCRGVIRETGFDGMTVSFLMNARQMPDLNIDLVGRHQMDNARTALTALDLLRDHLVVSNDALRTGFKSIRQNTGLRGRFELLRPHPRVLADVAHNPDGARALAGTLAPLLNHKPLLHLVFGAVQDKDVAETLHPLAPLIHTLYAVRADSHRALSPHEIAHHARQLGINTTLCQDVSDGLHAALAAQQNDDVVLICGSFFVVGRALALLDGDDGLLNRLHESLNDYITTALPEPVRNGVHSNAGSNDDADTDAADGGPASRRMTVKEWNPNEQPRERLMQHGAAALTDAELLAILLRTGTKEKDVLSLCRDLVNGSGSLTALAARPAAELQTVKGIGATKAVTLAAAFELAARLQSEPFASLPLIGGPEDVARLFIPRMRLARREEFHVVLLSTANRIIRTVRISEGSLNSSIVHPREVFRQAVIESAASVIGLHNHPSGNPKPSAQDIAITKQLSQAGKILGIPLHDHIIIAGDRYVSLAEEGHV